MEDVLKQITVPSIEEADQYTPFDYFDFRQMQEKDLDTAGGFSEKYLTLQMFYKYGLMRFFNDMLMLDEFDKELLESPLCFIPCIPERQNVYQKYGQTDYQFIYLRNNLFIENLSADEIKTLEGCLSDEQLGFDRLLEIVAKTYQKVLLVRDLSNMEEAFELIYELGAFSMKSARNNAAVFEIATSAAFDKDGNYINITNEQNKDKELAEFQKRMEENTNGILGIPVTVFIR